VVLGVAVSFELYRDLRQSLRVELGPGNAIDNDAMLNLPSRPTHIWHRWPRIELDDIGPAACQRLTRPVR